MGSLLRSEAMTLLQFVIPSDDAHDVMFDLGTLGVVQFKDLNPEVNAFQRNYVNVIMQLDELERKLRFFEDLLKKNGREMPEYFVQNHIRRTQPLAPQEIPEMEALFDETERELIQMNEAFAGISHNIKTNQEHVHVLQKYDDFVHEYETEGSNEVARSFLSVTSGVIARDRVHAFERILWRATRGNIFIRSADLDGVMESGENDEMKEMSMFMIMYKSSDHMTSAVEKLCQAFNTRIYQCPEQSLDRMAAIESANQQIRELKEVLRLNQERNANLLNRIFENIRRWKDDIAQEKAIYYTMNRFRYDSGRLTLLAEGWCPTSEVRKVTIVLQRQGKPIIVRQIAHQNEEPPTFFRTNKFTQSFQDIVDAYGVASYQEMNPAVFTAITFPFLFGVMFGDVGHGLLMMMFALWMLKNEQDFLRQNLGEILSMLFQGRYIILMMSLFSIYAGFMYNDIFGVSMALMPSAWEYQNGTLVMTHKDGHVYPFGVDSYWHTASNSLYFYNSLKMKMSVLMGVTQMCLGIGLSSFNAKYFKKPYNFWFEFVPQILFMVSLFGYLCLLILVKWFTDFEAVGRPAPALLNMFLQMFLSPLSFNKDEALYPGQHAIQIFLLILGVIAVPWMLIPKPLLLRRDYMKSNPMTKKGSFSKLTSPINSDEPLFEDQLPVDRVTGLPLVVDEESQDTEGGHEGEEFEFSEVLIEQIIHTIEFVLGAISNTASYLRLWALSLAHAQLSAVFYKTVVVKALTLTNPVAMFIAFGAWGGLTIGVLMVMESLSAFLHALRLHWVEFMNKFYHGTGRQFRPFDFLDFNESL